MAMLSGDLEAKLHELHEMLAGPTGPARVLHSFVQSARQLAEQCKAMLPLSSLPEDDHQAGLDAITAASTAFQLRNRIVHSDWLQDWERPENMWTVQVRRLRTTTTPITYEEIGAGNEALSRASLQVGALTDLVVRSQMPPAERLQTPEISDRGAVMRGAFVLVGAGPFYRLI